MKDEASYSEGLMDGVSACCQVMTTLIQAIEHKRDAKTVRLMVCRSADTMADILKDTTIQTRKLYEQRGKEK